MPTLTEAREAVVKRAEDLVDTMNLMNMLTEHFPEYQIDATEATIGLALAVGVMRRLKKRRRKRGPQRTEGHA